jgi:integrase
MPYLHREITRHGTAVWYVKKGERPRLRVRIRGEYGTPEFNAAYQAAISGVPASAGPLPAPKLHSASLEWLLARYRETTGWTRLSPATRRQRENIFLQIIKTAGGQPYDAITHSVIAAGVDRRAETPSQARNFLDAMRGLFRWAAKAGHVDVDPTVETKNPPRPKGSGFPMWTEEQMGAYEGRWPVGTRQRVWLDVLAYTGLRRGDAVRLGRQHVRDGVAKLKTEKSGHTTTVTLPILPALAMTLAAGPCGDLTFIVGANGKPLTKESFGNLFREACNAAGVPGSAHGVRKIAATRAAQNGATVAQLEAIFGWHGGGMASHYTKEADRDRLAREAMRLLSNDDPMFAPGNAVRTSSGKAK